MEIAEEATENVVPNDGNENGNIIMEEQVSEDLDLIGQADSIIFVIDDHESAEVTTSQTYAVDTGDAEEHNDCSNESNKLVMVENECSPNQTNGEDIRTDDILPENTKSEDNSSQDNGVPSVSSDLTKSDVQPPGPSESAADTSKENVEIDISEEEAHNILMKALEQIGPKIGKDFVLMFKDPNTAEVKEIASDKGKKFLEHNTDVVKKFSSICTESKSKVNQETINSDDENMKNDVTEISLFDDENEDDDDDNEDGKSTSNSGIDEEEDNFKKENVKAIKRAPRTSVMMNKLAKLDEKERLKNAQNFCCKYCPSKFGTIGNFDKHLKSKHNKGFAMKRGRKVKEKDDSDISEHVENGELQQKNQESSSKDGIMKIKDFGEFESVITTPEDINTPVNTPANTERKRGRGRPPKNKSNVKDLLDDTMTNTPQSEVRPTKESPDKRTNNHRSVGRPRKVTEDFVSQKLKKGSSKFAKYLDEDFDCLIKKHEVENSRISLECKLCLLRFTSNRMARDHILQEHEKNLEHCTKTLDIFPDSNKSSKFDKYIYFIEEEVKEGFMPSELFNTPRRGGRKRTPSKKLLESQSSLTKTIYVCKICHKRAITKTNMLQHMGKFHLSIVADESGTSENNDEEYEDQDEEEDGDEDEEEEEKESEQEVLGNDEDQDYKPSKKVMDVSDEECGKKSPSKGVKRKKRTEKPSQKKMKIEKESDEISDFNEVHVKIEVIPEEDHQNDQTSKSDENIGEEMEIEEQSEEQSNETEMTGDTGEESLTVKRRRSRVRPLKKIPSYYVYCDHDDTEITRKSAQNLPYCSICKRFKCLTCTLTFKNSSHINRHVRIIHNKEKKYKCVTCDAKFTTNESLQYHKKWHTGVKDVDCPYCSMKFLVYKNLRKHMAKHHPGKLPIRKKKTHQCEICKSIFSRKERLEYHMLEKHPANNPEKECRICGQKFDTEEQCFEHSDAHADMKKVPVAKCPHCPLYCSSKNNLKRHVDRVHLNIRKYLCTECGKRFKGRDAFIYHTKRHKDPNGRDFECHICQKKIATEKGLEIHLRIHSGLKPYVCETCGRGFSQKGNMLSHQAIHYEERPFHCEECHKTFKKKFDLYKHKKRHTIQKVTQSGDMSLLEGAGKIYECPIEDCKVLFCSTNDLKLHMRKHNNERPFECGICSKNFAVKSRLIRHLRNVHSLHLPESDLTAMDSPEFAIKMNIAREVYKEKKTKYQTVVIPQPSGEQIEVQIMTEDTEGVEDLLALANPTTFSSEKSKEEPKKDEDENDQEEGEIHFKIETAEEEGSNVQIINVREDSTGEVQIHTEEDNIVLDPAIIQTLLNSGQQTIYYYVDQ